MRHKYGSTAALLVAALLSGCASLSPGGHVARGLDKEVVSGIADTSAADAARAGADYERNPKDPRAAIAYGRALRELGSAREAVLVLARTSADHPHHADLLAEYAKALTAAGRPQDALAVFKTAQHLRPADWSLLSAQGIALDQMGRHDEARAHYRGALKLSPDNPDVLANLGLSLALGGQLDEAEVTLRRAVSQPGASTQVRQNLALVLGLRGRFGEAERLARGDLDRKTADNNVAAMRQMFEKPAQWADARDAAAKSASSGPETNPAPSPALARLDTVGEGTTAATRNSPPPKAAPAKAKTSNPAPVPLSNSLDETFFGFPW
jgi:Flp pilus assembly protein TadD